MIPRKLANDYDKKNLIKHFLSDIKDEDRRLRFGGQISDNIVEKYLKDSFEDFGCKNMWFIVDVGDRIVATCHVAYDSKSNTAEMGCTVSPDYRNQKIGQELFNRGITWARMAGAENVFMHCLSENRTIQHIAQKGGMTVVTIDPTEKESTIQIKQNQFEAGFKDMIMDQIAVYDAAIRQQTFFAKKFLKGLVK